MSDKRSLQLELLCGSSTLLQGEIGALFSLASSPLLKAKKTITQKLYTWYPLFTLWAPRIGIISILRAIMNCKYL